MINQRSKKEVAQQMRDLGAAQRRRAAAQAAQAQRPPI